MSIQGNSVGGLMPTAEQVGARPNTWTPTAADVGAIPKTGGGVDGYLQFGEKNNGFEWKTADGTIIRLRPYTPANVFQITIQNKTTGVAEFGAVSLHTDGAWEFSNPDGMRAAIGAAPSGFGLGGVSQPVNSADEATQSGFYQAPVFSEISSSGQMFGYVTKVTDQWITQIWHFVGLTIKRDMRDGVWQPIEFFNPPMKPGVEYRTILRHNGKVVYCKAISCGALPSAGNRKVVGTVTVAMTGVVGHYGYAAESNGNPISFPIYASSGLIGYHVVGGEAAIYIECEGDGSSFTSSYVAVWYIKD